MATNTTRLDLIKPSYEDDVDIAQLNTNADLIDDAIGSKVVTSSTRPSSPFLGQLIYESDTEDSFVWDGSEWKPAGGGGVIPETSTKTSSYTLQLNDENKIVVMNVDGGGTVTVPPYTDQNFQVGNIIGIYNINASQLTIVGGTGVTIHNAGSISQYAEVSLRKRADNEWVMVGPETAFSKVVSFNYVNKTNTFTAPLATGTDKALITDMEITLTPQSADSKILISGMINFGSINGSDEPYVTIWRSINGGTAEKVLAGDTAGSRTPINSMAVNLDAAATIGLPFGGVDTLPETWEAGQSVTYGVYVGHNDSATQTVIVNRDLTNTDAARYTRPMSYFSITEFAS